MNGYAPQKKKKNGLTPVSGIVIAQAISETIGITAGGSKHLRVDVQVSGVTPVGTITVALQHASPDGVYTTLAGANASATITAAGTVSLTQVVERSVDQSNMPLKSNARVILTTTNAGDALTVTEVWAVQEL